MNLIVEEFWKKFCEENNLKNSNYVDAFQFGSDAEWLSDLVVKGKKTATTSGYVFYEMEKEPLPQKGQFYIVLNSNDTPVAIIQIEKVEVLPMNEVSEEFALSEGEGDYEFWWNAHEKFFKEHLAPYNLDFQPNMLVVCETFKVVFK
ncbi:ASCH domain-containing protein [Clostridium sp.]|uniref:ASCH domain-containing protein n=1 Tax=Clostridium sp. TaxID=1506 RepID=UPI003463DA67